MGQDIASLGIRVTTDGVKQGATDLDKLAASGDRAAKSTDNLNKSFNQAGGIDKPAKAAAQAINQQTAALAKLAGQIDPTIAKLDKLDALQTQLGKFKKSGMISADDFAALNTTLDASRVKITSAGEAVHKFSLNNAMARRELGYLAKDLATGQYGRFQQSALTLANASGAMSLAFSGIGLAIGGVLAALGAFAVAAFKGSEEADAFNKALVTTGNYAGATSASLQDMARNMASSNTTQGAAAEALAKVAASGRFTASQIALVGQAAVDMSRLTGQSTDATIKQFESLQHAPVDALLKLNETQHFLTETIYEQIKALQDQGKEQDAATLAMQTYARSLSSRAKDVEDSAGTMVRAWHGVRDAAKAAWDAMLNAGRPASGDEKLGELQRTANAYAEQIQKIKDAQKNGSIPVSSQDYANRQIAILQQQFAAASKAYHDEEAKQQADRKATTKQSAINQALDAQTASDAEVKEFATNAQKRNAEKLAAQGRADVRYAQAMAVGNKALAKKILDDEVKIQAGIEAKYKDPRKPHVKADPEINAYKAFSAQVDALNVKAISEASPALQKYEQGIAKLGDELNVYMSKNGEATKAAALFLTGQKALQAELDKDNAQNASALKTYQGSLDQQIADKQKQIDLQVSALSMGAKEAQQQQELAAIYSQVDKTIEQLNRSRSQRGANVEYIDGEIAAQKASIPILVAQEKAKFSAMGKAQSSWEVGAKRAYANILDSASDVAGQTDSLFTNAFDSMGNALADFATTGKLDFKGLVTSILADLAKMEIRIAASKILQAFIGGMSGGSSGGGSFSNSDALGGSTIGGGYSGYGMMAQNANGGVYSSPSLSAYSGQIVTQPTAFAFAKGAGIMGEAGPEAILPLSRGADGKLGVKAGGSGGDVSISQTFVIDSNGNTTGKTSGAGDDSIRQFAGKMKSVAQQTILDEQRPGGSLWRMGQRA